MRARLVVSSVLEMMGVGRSAFLEVDVGCGSSAFLLVMEVSVFEVFGEF